MNTEAQAQVLVSAAEALGPQIRAVRDEIDRERRLPQPLVDAMAAAGLFRAWVPRALGGLEVGPLTATRVGPSYLRRKRNVRPTRNTGAARP